MRTIGSYLAAALLLAAGPALAEGLNDKAESSVSVGKGGEYITIHTVNSTYEWVDLWKPGEEKPQSLILKKTETATLSPGMEGAIDATVKLEVSEIGSTELEPLYTLEHAGNSGRVESFAWSVGYFTITTWGCCGALDTLHTYSLVDGKHLFSRTADIAWFEVPNARGLVRLAAVHTIYSVEDEALFSGRENGVAQLVLAAPDQPLQRFFVGTNGEIAANPIEYPEPWLGWAEGDEAAVPDLEVWSADGQQDLAKVEGLALVLTLSPTHEVRIPLVAGRLVAEQATMTPGLTLEEVAVE
ncbi:MAG TPA: hypothetical protein VJL84_08050 [Kiloniellales bacterium]|nr:hypothetical protein [Kiloniellales bacterium]